MSFLHSTDFFLLTEVLQARLYFQTPEKEVSYIVDKVSLTEIISRSNWKDEANARIEAHRKSNIILR